MIAALLPYKWIVGALALVAILYGLYFGYQHWANSLRAEGAAPYIVEISKQKSEAAALLATLQAQVTAKEKALQDFTNSRNENDKVNEGALNILADKLVTTRLRDPYQAGCRTGGSSTSGKESGSPIDSEEYGTQAGGLLSAEFDGFLKQKFKESDAINAAYASCRPSLYEAVKP